MVSLVWRLGGGVVTEDSDVHVQRLRRCWRDQLRARPGVARTHMTSLPGGAADKAGNVYEQLWTALRIADVLLGKASRIRLEPPGDDGIGIEFEIDQAGHKWGEQTKHRGSSWTVKRLRNEGVLAAAKHQVSRGRAFRFVTSSAASALEALSHRASSSNNLEEFLGLLTKDLQPDFTEVRECWSFTDADAWKLLRRIEVEQHSVSSLRRMVHLSYQLLYGGDTDLVVAALQEFCNANLHQELTAPQVAAYLRGKGFRERRLAGDEATRRKLHRTLERQKRRVDGTAPSFGTIPRGEVQQVIDDLTNPDGQQIVVVDAPAGYGKSVVAAEVASALDELGWFVAVARMDIAGATPTSDHLGDQMGLTESPAVLLAGVADGAPGLLVVDQLDAVSLFSGRMPDSYDAVEEVLDEIAGTPNLKVLLVARTVDLDNDRRLAPLRSETRASRHTLAQLEGEQVRRYLEDHGLRLPAADTVELLRTPLHLSVYARLSDDARELPYRTLKDLYDQYTPQIRRQVASRAADVDWQGITSLIVGIMSEKEMLTVPRSALATFRPEHIAALESEQLLVGDADIGFFHESFFDYLFAQAFVEGGHDLHTFLASSGQFLFRRAQARQVLDYLAAASDRSAFRDVTARLLGSPDIRSHLKHVVVNVLGQLVPEPEDWAAIEDVAWSDEPIGSHLLGLLSSAGWFDAADALGRWESWLEDPAKADRAARQLVIAARERGKRAAELFRPTVGASEQWRTWLRTLVAWSLNSELVPFAVELIEGGHIDDARGPIAVNSDFWSIVHGLLEEDPDGAARVTGAFLRRGLQRARQEGFDDPFDSDLLSTHSASGSTIRDVAENASRVFLEEVLPFVIDVAQANQHTRAELLPVGRRWAYRTRGSAYAVDDVVFAATEHALVRLAASEPDFTRTAIEPLRALESEELRFLACRALTALDDPDDGIGWLLADPRNLVLGWTNSRYWASRELIAAHSSGCSDELLAQLEASILAYRTRYERREIGHGIYVLLSGLDATRLSEDARRRLAELDRRFDAPPPAPTALVASFVGSPIPDEPAKRMSDENWLNALRKHSEEQTEWKGELPVGGASQLAQVLENRAKVEPERFAHLAMQFDHSIPATAGAHALRGVHANIDLELLTDLCEHLAHVYGNDVGREVCSAIGAAAEVNERLVALIDLYSVAVDPDREWARTEAGTDGNYYYGGDLFTAGLNCTRGEAALAAAAALFKGGSHVAALLPVVDRLATDAILAVRTCAADAIVGLLNHESDVALALAESLLDSPIDVLDARTTERLLTCCMLRAPERFAVYLQRAIEGPDDIAERGGHVWAVANYKDSLAAPLSSIVSDLPVRARLGVAQVLAENVEDSAESLAHMFHDPDPDVRAAASRGFRGLAEMAPDAVDRLIAAFLPSAAFDDNMDDLIDELEKLGTALPATALEVCERAVLVGGHGLADIRTARSIHGRDLIAIVLRLYRQGDPPTRDRCLNLIDRLTELNVYGVESALANER